MSYDPTVEKIQSILVRRGHNLGTSGNSGNGVDGDAGGKTFSAVLAELEKLPLPAAAPATPQAPFAEDAFFASVRSSGLFPKGLTQSQVDGIKAKITAYSAAHWPLSFASYGMATSYWETARTMQPIEEYGKGRGRKYGVPGKHGQIAYGRGDVQLTWDYNYETMDNELGLGGALIKDYSKALDPLISARIMVVGMSKGKFTGKKLSDYLTALGPSSRQGFKESRRIINGTDKWEEIADIALKWQVAFQAGGWK